MSIETGKIIKARLSALEKTQGWLAEQAGVSINAVSKWTRTGKIARAHVQLVADALGISAGELLSGDSPLELASGGDTSIERLSSDEKQLLELYRSSTREGQNLIMSSGHIAPKLPARSFHRPN